MAKRMATRRKKTVPKMPLKPMKQITCAFCGGRGTDPFGIPSRMSSCQVCKGSGKISMEDPAISCAFCGGSGVFLDKRLTCTVCGGKGLVPKPKEAKTCPDCRGRGMAPDGLPDLRCRGIGVI